MLCNLLTSIWFFYLNKQVHKLLHNHLSELWELGGVTLHLLVQNPFKELKEKWQKIRQIEQEQKYTCMLLCIWTKKWIPTTKSSLINRTTITDGRHIVILSSSSMIYFLLLTGRSHLIQCSADYMKKFAIAEFLL